MSRKRISPEDLQTTIKNLMNDKDGVLFLQWIFSRTYIFNANKGRDLREFAQKSGVNEIGYEVLHLCEICDMDKTYEIIKDLREDKKQMIDIKKITPTMVFDAEGTGSAGAEPAKTPAPTPTEPAKADGTNEGDKALINKLTDALIKNQQPDPQDAEKQKTDPQDKEKQKIFDPLGTNQESIFNEQDYKDIKNILGEEVYEASNKEQLKEFVDIAIKHKISAAGFKELYDKNVKAYELEIEKIRMQNSKITENLHKEFNMEQSEFIKTLQDGINKSNLGGLLKKYPMLTNDPDMWRFLANYSKQNSESSQIDLGTSNDNSKSDIRARMEKMLG